MQIPVNMPLKIKMPQADIDAINQELKDEKVTQHRVYSDTFVFIDSLPYRVMLDMVAEDNYAQMILYSEHKSTTEDTIHLSEEDFTDPEYETISDDWELHLDQHTITVTIVAQD